MSNGIQIDVQHLASLSVEDRIDEVCDLFEADWREGQRLDLRSYLSLCSPAERSRLFSELLLVDCELRLNCRENISWSDYLTAYPEFSELIEAATFKHCAAPPVALDDLSTDARRISHFELIEKIGFGACGDVWKARDFRLQRLVAVKIPRAERLTDHQVDSFLHEGRAAAQLRHPGIVPVHEVAREGGVVYIVSTYIPGTDLSCWLATHQPTPKQSAELCFQLAEALDHAHDQGIVHRDLKPSNILIDASGRAYITDFGLAKRADEAQHPTLDGELIGTPAYMAPEQARGQAARADCRTDVYALGVILFELLTGRVPFQGNASTVTHQILCDDPPRPTKSRSSIPRDLETICLRALQKEPRHRYQSAREIANDLRRFLAGEPILARRSSIAEHGWRFIRRRPASAVMLVLGLATIAALLLAGRLATENRSLLGLRTVRLSTDPSGARVVFLPIDAKTGEPAENARSVIDDIAPVEIQLTAGDYLVIATLEGATRFHEVYRHVPRDDETPGAFRHQRWKTLADDSIELPSIRIPEPSVTDDMVFISTSASTGAIGPSPQQMGASFDFYIDPHEFTEADFLKYSQGDLPPDLRALSRGPDFPASVSYDHAVAISELVGKRLPAESEYNFVVALAPADEQITIDDRWIRPVHEVLDDRTSTTPPVFGLRVNTAEWIYSTGPELPGMPSRDTLFLPRDYRLARGRCVARLDDNWFNPMNSDAAGDKFVLPRTTVNGAVGFRCARSSRPRLAP